MYVSTRKHPKKENVGSCMKFKKYKVCKHCNREKPTIGFQLSKNSDDGYAPFCTKCQNKLWAKQITRCEHYYDPGKTSVRSDV